MLLGGHMKHTNFLFIFAFACTPADEKPDNDPDEDGLTNAQEEVLGTDKNNPDSDGDGQSDKFESDNGSNPLNEYSKGYEQGNYIVGQCENGLLEPTDPSSEASITYEGETYTWPLYAAGDIAPNFTLTDQYGQDVDLYSFCGKVVMLVFSASWCPPCQDLAQDVQDIQDTAPDQIQVIELLIENEDYGGGVVETADQMAWATDFGMTTIPVLDADSGSGAGDWSYMYDRDGGIPSTVMIGPDMEIINVDRNRHDPTRYIE